MFSVAVIFRPGTHDDEFRRLDAVTQAVADDRGLPRLGNVVVGRPLRVQCRLLLGRPAAPVRVRAGCPASPGEGELRSLVRRLPGRDRRGSQRVRRRTPSPPHVADRESPPTAWRRGWLRRAWLATRIVGALAHAVGKADRKLLPSRCSTDTLESRSTTRLSEALDRGQQLARPADPRSILEPGRSLCLVPRPPAEQARPAAAELRAERRQRLDLGPAAEGLAAAEGLSIAAERPGPGSGDAHLNRGMTAAIMRATIALSRLTSERPHRWGNRLRWSLTLDDVFGDQFERIEGLEVERKTRSRSSIHARPVSSCPARL